MSDISTDKDDQPVAKLQKMGDIWTWRNWVVSKNTSGKPRYKAVDQTWEVYFQENSLKDIRTNLLVVRRVVDQGGVPVGCEKTDARIKVERDARPYEEKLAAANKQVKRSLQFQVDKAELEKAKFMEEVAINMGSAIEWGVTPLRTYFVGRVCGRLLAIEEEKNLPMTLRAFRKELAMKLLQNHLRGDSTGPLHRACTEVERQATSELVELLHGCEQWYSYEGIEINEE